MTRWSAADVVREDGEWVVLFEREIAGGIEFAEQRYPSEELPTIADAEAER